MRSTDSRAMSSCGAMPKATLVAQMAIVMGLTNHLHAAGEDFAVRPRGLTRCRLVSEVLCSVKSNSWLHAISFARWSILPRNVCAGRVRNTGFHHSAHLYGVHSRVKA